MKKIIKIIIFIILMLSMIVVFNKVNAASVTLSCDNEVEIGSTITIKANVLAAQWDLSLQVNGTEIVNSSELENFESNIQKTITGTYKATSAGTLTVTLLGDITDFDRTNTKINETKTIIVKEKETNIIEPEPEKEQEVVEPKFTEVNQTVYAKSETNVRASYSTSSEAYGKLAAGDSVTRIGIGDNGWSKVTYNGKTAYIFSNNLTTTKPEEPKSTDKKLKSIEIVEGTLEPEFDPDTTRYSVSVPNTVDKLTIDTETNDEKATVSITGNEKFVTGSNTVKITVTAEDGTTRIYNINVIKTEEDPLLLNSLSIPGITFQPEFQSNIYKYTIQIGADSNISDFAIQALPNKQDAKVEILGNSNFQIGENVITILVKSADDTQTVSYQIVVNKVAETKNGIFENNDKATNIALVVIAILLAIAIIVLIVLIVKKKREDSYYDDDDDSYRSLFNNDDLDTDEDSEKENFTGIFKNQIMEQDEMKPVNMENTGRFSTGKINRNENYIPEIKQEKTFEDTQMTRKFSTRYDQNLESNKRNKGTGKGKHF